MICAMKFNMMSLEYVTSGWCFFCIEFGLQVQCVSLFSLIYGDIKSKPNVTNIGFKIESLPCLSTITFHFLFFLCSLNNNIIRGETCSCLTFQPMSDCGRTSLIESLIPYVVNSKCPICNVLVNRNNHPAHWLHFTHHKHWPFSRTMNESTERIITCVPICGSCNCQLRCF